MLNPKYPRARQSLAETLAITGRFEESKTEARRALDLDPLALSLNPFMSMTHYFVREYDKTIEHGVRTVEMDSNFFPGHFYLGLSLQMAGRFGEAATALQEARELSQNSTLMTAALGGVFAASGKEDEARGILAELEEIRQRKYVSQVFIAAILAGLGEIDRALACLETAYEDRCPWLARCLVGDGRLDKLQSHSRWRDLLRQVGVSRR
jgi:tetratricopeptide (TPR) repeat protein